MDVLAFTAGCDGDTRIGAWNAEPQELQTKEHQ